MPGPGQPWSPPLPEAPGFEHSVVETPGLRTHLAAIGEGEPVLLLHGFPEHWWQWHAVAPAIAAAGYRLLALLDALDLERVHLVSHDMGVITAFQLTYDHPERVRTAVQLSVWPAFIPFSPRLAPAFQHLPPFIWHRPGASLRPTFSDRYAARPMSEATIEQHLRQFSRTEVDAAVRPLVRRMVLPEAMRMARGVYRRKRLTVPTLVVFGRRDHPTTEDLLARLCRDPERHADRLELAWVDDAAHFITDDAPREVADLAVNWFARAA
jgi:pimeloyl-ACP methyl ester carboxylesterase